MDSFYAAEKLYNALWVLATHPSDIKTRLKIAVIEIASLTEANIPADFVSDFNSIRNRLTRTQGPNGAFYASVDAMTEEEAIQLAKDILDLQSKVS